MLFIVSICLLNYINAFLTNSNLSFTIIRYLRTKLQHMFRFTILLSLFLLPLGLFAQIQDTIPSDSTFIEPEYNLLEEMVIAEENGGIVEIHMPTPVQELLKLHINRQKEKKSFSGYRIQIFSFNSLGCDIEKLKELRDTFEETFQTIPAYLKYFDPDFKIRIGNFHSRLESIPTLYRIRAQYPGCYPVKTQITLDDMKRIPMQDILKEEETNSETDTKEQK